MSEQREKFTWRDAPHRVTATDPEATGSAPASATYLVRMDRGARFGPHHHGAVEHCFVVAGDLHVAGHHLHTGDYHRADQHTTHDETASEGGCLLLIVESPG